MNLAEWAKHYIKFKDCMKRQITSIEELDGKLLVHEKKEDKLYCIAEELKNSLLEEKKCEGRKFLVTLNTPANVKFLADNWQLVQNDEITIIFANIKTNESWTIHPKTHSKIIEDKTIKQGLMSLHESITSC
ncbi:hypothetical protein JXA48_04760 [Candidatus Woesearchaeota archaeon]|nr:hypothetical protein [Candidatus Woesearchaeota archaeon]